MDMQPSVSYKSETLDRSKGKTCGICLEVIVDNKDPIRRQFGILPQCQHCFCLGCIRTWRRELDVEDVRGCPECRVISEFVCPSLYWIEGEEEKEKLIKKFKNECAEKKCNKFKQGRGTCPYGNQCFYLHALVDGTKIDVGSPPPRSNSSLHRHWLGTAFIDDAPEQFFMLELTDDTPHYSNAAFNECADFLFDSDDSE